MAPHSNSTTTTTTATTTTRPLPPFKQRMALSIQSFVASAQKLVLGDSNGSSVNTGTNTKPTYPEELFPATSRAADGDDCDHDCDSCSVKYPRDFRIDEADQLYGHVKGWSTHVLVATGKSDWVRDVADEKGSVMEALDRAAAKPANGRMMLSASNIPTPHGTTDYSEPTTVLLLPAFAIIHNVSPATAPALVDSFVNRAATSATPLSAPLHIPRSIPIPTSSSSSSSPETAAAEAALLTATPCPHNVLILLCSQRTRDARCGQSAPLLKRELERHLRPLGLYRDFDDHRPGGVGIYFISHVGGHKYSANMMVYRRPNAFGVDDVDRAQVEARGEQFKIDPLAGVRRQKETQDKDDRDKEQQAQCDKDIPNGNGHAVSPQPSETPNGKDHHRQQQQESQAAVAAENKENEEEGKQEDLITDEGAAQCIWLARIRPEDCENIVRYTVLQGRVVKPETQLRGGFDRGKSLISW